MVNGTEVDLTKAEIDEYNQRQADWEASKNERLYEQYSEALQLHIDAAVKAKDYNDGFACASYANSTNETWKQEAQDFIAWRDSCWQYAIDVQNDVESGTIEPPTLEDFINAAPNLNWS